MEEALAWYRQRQPGLDEVFAAALDDGLARIAEHPEGLPIVHRAVRRALIARFPYGVFYLLEESRVIVIACLHAARDPSSWRRKG